MKQTDTRAIETLLQASIQNAEEMKKSAEHQSWDVFETLSLRHERLWEDLSQKIQQQYHAFSHLEQLLNSCTDYADRHKEKIGTELNIFRNYRKADDAYRGS